MSRFSDLMSRNEPVEILLQQLFKEFGSEFFKVLKKVETLRIEQISALLTAGTCLSDLRIEWENKCENLKSEALDLILTGYVVGKLSELDLIHELVRKFNKPTQASVKKRQEIAEKWKSEATAIAIRKRNKNPGIKPTALAHAVWMELASNDPTRELELDTVQRHLRKKAKEGILPRNQKKVLDG